MDALFSGLVSLMIASALAFAVFTGVVGFTLEMLWPAGAISRRSRLLSLWFAFVDSIVLEVTGPIIFAGTMLVLADLGFGLIPLSNSGIGLVISAAAYLLVLDCVSYWTHRLEHSVPALWAMHSFHHSATEVETFAARRVYWLSRIVQGVISAPILALLFTATPNVLLISLAVQFVVTATNHLNVRVHLGRLGLVVMGPQFHRIHHSVERRHWDKNFAQRFPIWDVIFGTLWNPARDEWPETGLGDGEPAAASDAILWPLRYLRRHVTD